MASNAVVGRRRLASGLRRRRQSAGLTIEDMARALECSPAKISRMETGAVGVRLPDLQAISDVLDLPGPEREHFVELVRAARSRGWWQDFSDVVPPDSAMFYGLEDGADRIAQHSTSLVPGLLQTREYASALLGSVRGVPGEIVERRLELRLRRQQILRRESPPTLHVVLDEAVLHRPVGGPEVMGKQIDHLLELADESTVDIRVVPFSGGIHAAAGVSFTVFGFDDPGVTPVVFGEQLTRNAFVDDPDETRSYEEALRDAAAIALDAAASRSYLSTWRRQG